jgi:hypothetical protein
MPRPLPLLDTRHAQVLAWRNTEGLSFAAIAPRLGVSRECVRQLYASGRKRLAALTGPAEPPAPPPECANCGQAHPLVAHGRCNACYVYYYRISQWPRASARGLLAPRERWPLSELRRARSVGSRGPLPRLLSVPTRAWGRPAARDAAQWPPPVGLTRLLPMAPTQVGARGLVPRLRQPRDVAASDDQHPRAAGPPTA